MKYLRLLLLSLMVLVVVPGFCWGQAALVVHDGTIGTEAGVVNNLSTHLTAAGYTVTTNVGVPGGSLSGYGQVWDVRFNNTTPLSGSDITAYITYLSGGGSLFVMGENTGFMTRNNSISALITAGGGGTIAITAPNYTQTVQSPFTGPNAITTVAFLACAGATTPPGSGTFVTKDVSNIGAALVFDPGSLTNATSGTLIVVFDVNFLEVSADPALQNLTDNLIAYLAAPVPIQGSIPTLSEWGMILFAALLIGFGAMRMRRRPESLS